MEKQCNNKLYFATINWYEEYTDRNLTNKCYIFAPSYADACEQIETQFSYIENIHLEEIACDCGPTTMLYVPDDSDIILAINNENNY